MSYSARPNPWLGVPLVGDLIDAIQTFLVNLVTTIGIRNETADVGARGHIDFHAGTGISLTITDDPANDEVDVTIVNTVTDTDKVNVRNNTVDVAQRPNLDFHAGSGISLTIADDSTNDEVDITVTSTVQTNIANLVTSLPGSPTDKQKIVYTDSTSAPTYYWELVYNATTGKWHFVGGSPLRADTTTDELVNSGGTNNTWYVPPTATQLTLPLAGDYEIDMFAQTYGANGATTTMGAGSATAPSDADSVGQQTVTGSSSQMDSLARSGMRRTGHAAGDVLKLWFKASNNIAVTHVVQRTLAVRPIKVG